MFVKQIISMDDAKKMIQNGEVIFLEDGDRRVFKTSSMVAYAYWSGKPLVVSTKRIQSLIKDEYSFGQFVSVYSIGAINDRYLAKYIENSNLLVDDISYDEYEKLVSLGYSLAGFVRK